MFSPRPRYTGRGSPHKVIWRAFRGQISRSAAPWEVAEARRASGAGDEGFERDTLIMAALGRATSGVDYVASVQRRHQYTRRLTTFFETYDLLLTPTLAKPPPLIGEFDLAAPLQRVADALLKTRTARFLTLTKIVDDTIEQNLGWAPYTQLANLTGRPAKPLPLHWSAEGVPLGVQFVAPLGGGESADPTLRPVGAGTAVARPTAGALTATDHRHDFVGMMAGRVLRRQRVERIEAATLETRFPDGRAILLVEDRPPAAALTIWS